MRRPERLTRRARIRALVAVLAGLVVFVAGVWVGGNPRTTGLTNLPPPVRDVFLGPNNDPIASEVLGLLEDGYYREIDSTQLSRASVDGLLKALQDPYSFYLDAEQYAAMQRHLDATLTGIGVSVAERPRGITILDVYPEGPAHKGGLKRGDVIISVDGERVRGPGLDSVVERIRGPKGTEVKVGIRRRDADDRVYTLTRAEVKIPLVRSRVISHNDTRVGYLRLSEFDRGAGDQVRRALGELKEKGAQSFVFDLRGDPGGLVDEAVKVAGAFLPQGSTVVTTEGRHRGRSTLRTRGGPASKKPLAVLVDRDSASASEIVAGALRDHERAKLVGTRTFGKALVQTTRPLRNGGALRYTTARYLTPSGLDLAGDGLPPDVQVEDDPDTPDDEALDKAVEVVAADTK